MTQSIYYQIFHYLETYLNACTNSLIKVTADRNYKSRLVEQHYYYLYDQALGYKTLKRSSSMEFRLKSRKLSLI